MKLKIFNYKGYNVFKKKKKIYLLPSNDLEEGEIEVETEQYKKLKRLSLAKTDEIIGGKRNNVFDLAIAINEDKI